jgi:hypothetical protein
MKYLLIIFTFIIGYIIGLSNQDAEGAIDYRAAAEIAYEKGREDSMYQFDDLNTVRLTQSDINKLIGE